MADVRLTLAVLPYLPSVESPFCQNRWVADNADLWQHVSEDNSSHWIATACHLLYQAAPYIIDMRQSRQALLLRVAALLHKLVAVQRRSFEGSTDTPRLRNSCYFAPLHHCFRGLALLVTAQGSSGAQSGADPANSDLTAFGSLLSSACLLCGRFLAAGAAKNADVEQLAAVVSCLQGAWSLGLIQLALETARCESCAAMADVVAEGVQALPASALDAVSLPAADQCCALACMLQLLLLQLCTCLSSLQPWLRPAAPEGSFD